MTTPSHCTAFAGRRRIASGPLRDVALAVRSFLDKNPSGQILVFDDETAQLVELDLRGSPQDIASRLADDGAVSVPAPARGPGRPKLGVVAREVTLLPRHWDWLSGQPGGASVALRRLVEEARRAADAPDRRRRAQQAAYRFMSAVAGDEPGYEEACRALFAGDAARFDAEIRPWPEDLRAYARSLAEAAFA
jgi:uncharacterized protein